MILRSKHVCAWSVAVALPLLAGCPQVESGESAQAICEQDFRVDDQNFHFLGAGCSFYSDQWSSTYVSDSTATPDLKVVCIASRLGLQVTATSRGTMLATRTLFASELKSGEKLILTVTTLGGDTYEFRYWGSTTIDPAQYLDGIDAGWADGAFH
jgi:hypothetical protein